MSCVGFKAAVDTMDLFVGVVVHDENGDAWSASAGILVHLAYAVTVQRRRLSWTWLGVHVEGDRLPEARARASSISRRDPKLRSAERPRSAAGKGPHLAGVAVRLCSRRPRPPQPLRMCQRRLAQVPTPVRSRRRAPLRSELQSPAQAVRRRADETICYHLQPLPKQHQRDSTPGLSGSAYSARRLTTIASCVLRAITITAGLLGSGFSSRCGTNGGTKT